MASLNKTKPVSNDVLMDRELARNRIVEEALWPGRAAPTEDLQAKRDVIIRRWRALMEEYQQGNPREFLVSLRGFRATYNPERDGPSHVMRLVDSIDDVGLLEVTELLKRENANDQEGPKQSDDCAEHPNGDPVGQAAETSGSDSAADGTPEQKG